MSRWGVDGAPIPPAFPFHADLAAAAAGENFPPGWIGAVAATENVALLSTDPDAALTVVSGDNGHGLCQVTPATWWSAAMNAAWAAIDWRQPQPNAAFALQWFLLPAIAFWNGTQGLSGDELVMCVAAEYNAGRTAAVEAHAAGNVDAATTGHDYAARTLANLHALRAGKLPW